MIHAGATEKSESSLEAQAIPIGAVVLFSLEQKLMVLQA